MRWLFGFALLMCFAPPGAADEFDDLRLRWRRMLTGGDELDLSFEPLRRRVLAVESAARNFSGSMQKAAGRTALWSDQGSAANSSHITGSWSRLRQMALAWATPGQSFYHDAQLLADIRAGMQWMDTNRYHSRVTNKYDNWWDWEIGAPMELNDLLVLLYAELTPEELGRHAAAIDRFAPDPRIMITNTTTTGANRVWKCKVAAVRAVLVKDDAKLRLASDSLGPVFAYVTSGDGFYEDGSFIQHGRHPYTGGYGVSLLAEITNLLYLLGGSTWAPADPRRDNLFRWVFESFEPVIYRGALMDMVRGREISRSGSPDRGAGHRVAASLVRLSLFAPEEHARRIRSMVKEWYASDTARSPYDGRSADEIVENRRLMQDAEIQPRGELTGSFIFPAMDRVVHLRPGWGLGIAMHSTRTYNFESINNENLKGWHTADGATWLYNADLTQFSNDFWPTADPQRLPGTTVVAGSTPRQSQAGRSSISGGASLGDIALAMMHLRPDRDDLSARKSWFLFDDEVVALGSDIRASGAASPVETVVENRMIGNGDSLAIGEARDWAHLSASADGAAIGYYFPAGAGWQSAHGERRGSWRDINGGGSTTSVIRRYATIWFDHGAAPQDASYAYALLPGRSQEATAAYAAKPDFEIVERSADVHAVRESVLGLRAAAFWVNEPRAVAGITADRVAAVLVREVDGVIHVAVADPTSATSGVVNVEVDSAAARVIEQDSAVTVERVAPGIRFSVNLRAARGRTFRVKFEAAARVGQTGSLRRTGSPPAESIVGRFWPLWPVANRPQVMNLPRSSYVLPSRRADSGGGYARRFRICRTSSGE